VDAASRPVRGPKWSSLTVLAVYLKQLRLILDEAVEARRLMVRKLGGLMEEAHVAHRSTIIQAVGRVGVDEAAAMRKVRNHLERLEPPPPACESCHSAVAHWLDEMVLACDVMVDVGRSGDLGRLHETQEHLAESRADARRFNTEYEQLLGDLKRRAKTLGAKKQSAAPKTAAGGLRRLVRRVRRPARKAE
jgi:hypothetical protein